MRTWWPSKAEQRLFVRSWTSSRAHESLETFPLLGRRVPGHISRREWVVRFGHGAYIVIYEVKTDTVIILTVRHSREALAPAR